MKRFPLLSILAACLCLVSATAQAFDTATAPNPLTIPEICAKLKSGTSNQDMVNLVTTRRLLDRPTPAEEQSLRDAGADAHLLATIDSGSYILSPFEANDVRKRLAAGPQPGAATGSGHLADLLRGGKLVTFKNGYLQGYDDGKLTGKKYIGLYFSAGWCPPCQKFTPKLVEFYNQMAQRHPEVEIVFISDDETALDMQNYMRNDRMPWPALRFDRKPAEHELKHYAGHGIPDLVLLDADGKVLADSYEGQTYHGPYRVVNHLIALLNDPALTRVLP